tara:strand:- start:522 stop:860 length:339 start_codon:yes stop_codon:yes gene_type:complete
MSSGTWVYILVPVGNLDDDLPSQVTRYDYDTEPSLFEPPVRVHPTYREAAKNNRANCALGASDGVHTIWKCNSPTLMAGGDLDQFRALGWTIYTQPQAAEWAGNIPPPDEGG